MANLPNMAANALLGSELRKPLTTPNLGFAGRAMKASSGDSGSSITPGAIITPAVSSTDPTELMQSVVRILGRISSQLNASLQISIASNRKARESYLEGKDGGTKSGSTDGALGLIGTMGKGAFLASVISSAVAFFYGNRKKLYDDFKEGLSGRTLDKNLKDARKKEKAVTEDMSDEMRDVGSGKFTAFRKHMAEVKDFLTPAPPPSEKPNATNSTATPAPPPSEKSNATNSTATPVSGKAAQVAAMLKKNGLSDGQASAYVAQMSVETGNFKYMEEKWNGKGAQAKYKDGERYKGRGLIMLTGRANYADMQRRLAKRGMKVDLVNHPELASTDVIADAIAVEFWNSRIKGHGDTSNTGVVARIINPTMGRSEAARRGAAPVPGIPTVIPNMAGPGGFTGGSHFAGKTFKTRDVNVANADPAIVALGNALIPKGMKVDENSYFSPLMIKNHATHSAHYNQRAIDVNLKGQGFTENSNPRAVKIFDQLALEASKLGFKVFWNHRIWENGQSTLTHGKHDVHHTDHIHFETPKKGVPTSSIQRLNSMLSNITVPNDLKYQYTQKERSELNYLKNTNNSAPRNQTGGVPAPGATMPNYRVYYKTNMHH